jgi:hypothetical protein
MAKRSVFPGLLAGVLIAASTPVLGSRIEDAVKKTDEGTVRITFAARDGV